MNKVKSAWELTGVGVQFCPSNLSKKILGYFLELWLSFRYFSHLFGVLRHPSPSVKLRIISPIPIWEKSQRSSWRSIVTSLIWSWCLEICHFGIQEISYIRCKTVNIFRVNSKFITKDHHAVWHFMLLLVQVNDSICKHSLLTCKGVFN